MPTSAYTYKYTYLLVANDLELEYWINLRPHSYLELSILRTGKSSVCCCL